MNRILSNIEKNFCLANRDRYTVSQIADSLKVEKHVVANFFYRHDHGIVVTEKEQLKPEEIDDIVNNPEEIGIHEMAIRYGISENNVYRIRRKARINASVDNVFRSLEPENKPSFKRPPAEYSNKTREQLIDEILAQCTPDELRKLNQELREQN